MVVTRLPRAMSQPICASVAAIAGIYVATSSAIAATKKTMMGKKSKRSFNSRGTRRWRRINSAV